MTRKTKGAEATPNPSPEAALLTEIMVVVFRLNGRLLEKGDQLVAPLNITSARWQVLGAVALAQHPLSAPQIAEAMGVTRQGAQKQLNKLEKDGFFEQRCNPRHQRSPLYALTAAGDRAFAETMTLEAVWANGLAAGLSARALQDALRILNAVYERLDSPVPKKEA
jgi:DNA-binding MarR family transcriptional regulator